MCRMLSLIGNLTPHALSSYEKLVEALVSSAYYDPYAAKIFGEKGSSHKHGWGRATVYLSTGKASYAITKHMHPVYVMKPDPIPLSSMDDDFFRPFLIDMIHVRAASPETPVNLFNVQPFEFVTKSGGRLIIAHNGSVDKEAIASELNGSISREVAEKHSDTFILGQALSQNIGEELDINAIRTYKQYVKSALNLILILMNDSSVQVAFGSYFTNSEQDQYYRLYLRNDGQSIIVSSSTAIDFYYDERGSQDWVPVKNGEFYKMKIAYRDGKARIADISKHLL